MAEDEVEILRRFFAGNPEFQTPQGCGVVTASDGNLFRGLRMLLSIGGRAPVAVFDLGLSDQQIAWCEAMQNVRLMKPPMLPVPKFVHMWQAWNKPFYLKASPFECTIWIDADAFVTGDLTPLFGKAGGGFWVIKHQRRYPKPNDGPPSQHQFVMQHNRYMQHDVASIRRRGS